MTQELDTDGLLKKTAEGDSSAGNLLLQRHRVRLTQMVAMRMDRRLKARCDPSDIIQEALLTAGARLGEYSQDRPIPFYPWLRNIAWEHLIKFHEKHLEAQKRSVKREEPQNPQLNDQSVDQLVDRLDHGGQSPSENIMKSERRAKVRGALKALKPRDREVIELRYLEHLDNTDAAAVLGISVAAVRTRHFRAIQRLQSFLQDERDV